MADTMDFVMDANILGEVCRNNKNALKLVIEIRKHRVVYCTEIFKEYKALRDKRFCRNNSRIIREWLIGLTLKYGYGKKIKVKSNANSCFRKLVRRRKFKKKDIVYIFVAQKTKDKLLVAFEKHFINADRCISELGIERMDLEGALKICNR